MQCLSMIPIALLCALGACRTGLLPAKAIRTQLERRNQELIAHGERGDLAAAAAMHATDTVLVPPNGKILQGEAALRALAAPAGATVRDTRIETVQAGGTAELAYSVGTFEYTVDRDGASSSVTGPFVIVWTRDADGEWQVQVDMWNRSR